MGNEVDHYCNVFDRGEVAECGYLYRYTLFRYETLLSLP
jgi:hypothetical protein